MNLRERAGGGRRMLVPEVTQTSDTDCGPACMTSFLEGFGIRVPYGQLRDDCYTDVDGTSIDDMEDVAVRFGLDAHQTMLPPEHLLSGHAGVLPAIVVLALPGGVAHFVVVWRQIGAWFQVMDPMVGRRWMHRRHLVEVLYRHRTTISAEAWRAWAGTDAGVLPLRERLRHAGLARGAVDALVSEALDDGSWCSLATLDALTRLVESAAARGPAEGREAASLLAGFAGRGVLAEQSRWVPERFFSARALPGSGGDAAADELSLSGAVLVTASERLPATSDSERQGAAEGPGGSVWRQLCAYLRADGALTPSLLAAVAALAGCTAAFEALLFKGVLALESLVYTPEQRVAVVLAVAAFVAAVMFVDVRLAAGVRTLGRRLEARLRVDFSRKLARLPDSFFVRRLTSDLTLRIHSVVQLRGVPAVAEAIVRSFFTLTFTAAAIAWVDPACAGYALLALVAAIGLPAFFQPRLGELQLSTATYQGGLSRYLLDALLGALPLRSHGAQQALCAEYDQLLGRWAGARREVIRASVLVDTALSATGVLMAAAILYRHLSRGGNASSALLLAFWAQQLTALGRKLARSVFEYPTRRAAGARVLEPINTRDAALAQPCPKGPAAPPRGARGEGGEGGGMRVAFHQVGLAIGRVRVVDAIDVTLEPGCHCAVVGASGAGKSSLIGLLMGWLQPTAGRLEIDGQSLDEHDRDELSERVAWVDPQVQLWNRSLYENLTYGSRAGGQDLAEVIETAGLRATLNKLPEGLNTNLGEGGSALSQGEGQRVRLARALLRRDARLVLLDEPFRGLDRKTRARFMGRVRRWWRGATLICVTHDVSETLGFDRVLVLDGGRVVEAGRPAELARRPGSAYAQMLDAERQVRAFFDEAPLWRRLSMRAGRLRESAPRAQRARPQDAPANADAAE